ncbi:hypothetical protein QCN29_30335 [Streptomyces sp. HNM0663]|uniref:Uncharacterized protein n=1 Tax=Streptomyces chengmaiensis TaxID=3040919 RepID=A0ABT6HWC6_9ACTN|nr:hypothetical protein [Streptomyces chengmaiensis]MDH2393000.1 hypothetical protein [Streptomyces chengmaiensis]
MTGAVAPEVRAAQRRIVSTINASSKLNGDGLAMWREVNCGEWKATAADIGRDLVLLQVPHTIVTAFRFPLASSYSKAMREGEEVRVLRKERRLVCGQCCNDGVDEMERLAAVARASS